MGERMRAFDWSQTALGSAESWPQSLRTAVSICLNSRFPMILWWGPELTVLYNDPYIPILGEKHPQRALGLPGAEVWAEVWPVIGPMLMRVMVQGEANWADDLQLFINRSGYAEECYFRFSYSPISDESGGIGGVFTPVSETTHRVVAERRLQILRELADCGNCAQSALQACERMAEVLSKNAYDLPFAALYLVDGDGTQAELAITAGVAAGQGVSPQRISLAAGVDSVIERAVAKCVDGGGSMQVLSDLFELGALPEGPWGAAPSAVVVAPVRKPGQGELTAILVAGVSARKRLDADYRSFFELVAQQIGTGVSAARAYEEERRRAEALAELDKAKTTFFSNISHEFRTPLTLLLGPIEEVLERGSEVPADVSEQLRMAHRNGLRLQKMVNALLDFSRLEAGRAQALYEATDLGRLTIELASTFRSVMESAGLAFTVACEDLGEEVWVDREMWEKVVLNLLSNAFKFTLQGGVTVRLRRHEGRAQLVVEDTGTGIAERELPHVFERFHQAAGANGRTQEGSGIGLALVSELVKLHGGAMSVQSTVGEGSVFTVSIPFGHAHLPREHVSGEQQDGYKARHSRNYLEEANRWLPEKAKVRQQAGRHAGGRVLLADDNADMREYVRRLLEGRYEITTASNGREALSLAEADPPDLILSDVMMPELDGFGLLRAVRENQTTSRVPVILLSARAGEEALSEGMDAGADDYLVKPFSAQELLARVGAHVKVSRSRRLAELREMELRAEAEDARDHAVGVLESITDGFFTLDENWCFTFVNSEGERLMGASREALLGKNHWELFAATLGSVLEQEYRRAARDRVPVEFENYYGPWQRWFAMRVYPSKDGGVSVYFRDITYRKEAEEALRESEKRFRELADNISQFAWVADKTGSLIWYNQRWYDYTGTSIEQMRGMGWQAVHHPEHVARVTERFRIAVEEGRPWEDTFPLRGKHGEWRWFLSRARPIQDEAGEIVRWFGTNTDVTEQLETERNLRRANQDLEQFAFSASHDLQEPLRNVAIYSQLLQKRCGAKLDAQAEQFLAFVLEGAQRMGHLIADLLTYTQAATFDNEAVTGVEAEKVLAQVLTGLSRSIEESGATITHDPLPEVAIKEVHLQQLLQNLIGNAVKYRKDGELPRAHVSAVLKGNEWEFSIEDNGIGIAPQFQDKVFGIFKRLHPKGGKYPGTGIGLAICQRIIERYGGRIWVESEAGRGAKFYFTVPSSAGVEHGQ